MAVAIRVRSNADDVAGAFGLLYRDQMPFAIKQAINATAKDAQEAQLLGMEQRFTIRRRQWVQRSFKIKPFATKQRLMARITVEPPGGQARADVLTRHEEAGFRVPFAGRSLAVPVKARKSPTAVIPARDRPKAMDFKRTRSAGGGKEIFAGKGKTIMVRNADGSGVIFRKTGGQLGRDERGRFAKRGGGGTELLYVFKPTTRLLDRLRFIDTVTTTVRSTFEMHFSREFSRAVRSAR